VKKHFSTLYKDTLKLDNTPLDAILDPGDLATLHKKARNTTPTPRPAHFGDVMHMDIVFGPEVAIGNVHFGLTTVITDSSVKSSDTKSDWIKFAGDPQKFRSWYLAVMAQISIAPWQELYDSSMNSVVRHSTQWQIVC